MDGWNGTHAVRRDVNELRSVLNATVAPGIRTQLQYRYERVSGRLNEHVA